MGEEKRFVAGRGIGGKRDREAGNGSASTCTTYVPVVERVDKCNERLANGLEGNARAYPYR